MAVWAWNVSRVVIFRHRMLVVGLRDSSAVFSVMWLETQGCALQVRFA